MKGYITKLNDRNLQRKKATGITNYVLYSLVAIILFKVIALIPEIHYENVDFNKLAKSIWYSFCLSLALYFIYFSFLTSFENSSSVRILKYTKKSESYFLSLNISIIFLTTIVPAFLILWNSYKSNSYDFSVNEIILFVLTGVNLVFVLSVIFSKKKELYKVINKTGENNEIMSKVIFGISLLVVIISTYELFSIELNENFNKSNLVLTCLLVFSMIVISEKIIESYKDDIFSKDLENLEYEIYLKDLSDNDIREILQKKYMGFLITDWIKFKESEIESEYEFYEKEELIIKNKESELKEIDKEKYSIEFKGREDEINALKNKLSNKKKRFFENHISEINEVLKKDSTIKTIDFNKLKELILKLSSDKQ